MRKHSVRKWLHAILDLLPLFVIPVFALAVRSDNNFQPITISTSGYEVQNKYETSEVKNYNDLQNGYIYSINLDTYYDNLTDYINDIDFVYLNYIYYTYGDTNVFEIDDSSYTLFLGVYDNNICLQSEDNSFRIVLPVTTLYIVADWNDIGYDLWQYNIIPNESNYNVLEYVYVEGIVYDNTDVGSQMIYTLYETVDKYFNFNEVGTFNDMYEWVQTNIFNGSTPLVVPIVWNIVLYEFIMDILFLFYAVFMFIVDFAESMIDRAFYKAHKGCD